MSSDQARHAHAQVRDPVGDYLVRQNLLPPGFDWVALVLVVIGFAALYLPSYATLASTVWDTDEQGHGPIILAVAFWLLYRKRDVLHQLAPPRAPWLGWVVLLFALLLYVIGRAFSILMFEVGSQIPLLVGLALLFRGGPGLRQIWFPLVFLLFMVPLPEALVASVTGPLKTAVSAIASTVLYAAGYPVGRTGVLLTVGPYQLLVADACAGLNSMFTLEALGMLYMNLMGYTSKARNTLLALLLIPIAFVANITRVIILVLVTYHFGDEAGQGFVHGFAGMVLFMVALALMLAIDKPLGLIFDKSTKERA